TMPFFWVLLWLMLPLLALSSGPDRCAFQEGSTSSLLESLQCYNDYKSSVHCKWRKHRNTLLYVHDPCRELCVPYSPPVPDEPGTVRCEYKTRAFSTGIKHMFFFLKDEAGTICSSVPHKPLDLSLHCELIILSDVYTHTHLTEGDGSGGPAPTPPPSSVNKVLTYQLRYRTDRHDNWTTKNVTDTGMKIEKRFLLPGHRYEAKVRARAGVGQWSDWSPVVTWKTEEDTGQPPSLHCVLDGEVEVMCSWEVRTEMAHFLIYELACRHNPTEPCCVNPRVTFGLNGTVLRYSCSLNVTDPAHLLLELIPTHHMKTFNSHQHIRPNPPQQVTVMERDNNWIVKWTESSTASKVKLSYQVYYYRREDPLLNISAGSLSVNIRGASLEPSQQYQVKVRALVAPGFGYKGVPSEWTDAKVWTSNPGSTTLYVIIGAVVALVFLILYYTIPACQRKVILWVDSVPSPEKSKILSEIKSTTSQSFTESEDTSICKVLRFNSESTCSSDTSLWLIKDADKTCLELDEGCWNCDNLPPSVAKVNSSDMSSICFSGPYIFCQVSYSAKSSVDDAKCEEKEKEGSSNRSPSPVNFALYGEGYVCLPGRTMSRSTQDLASHSETTTNTHRHDVAEQHQQCSDTTPRPDETDQTTSRNHPPPYNPTPFTLWPQGGNLHASGYCHLPQH
uniref:Colony stimulating factor 2 receptor subunit beta n=1 Tax=Mastacembelus armatus TaxID=205130 RepID=A0A3Q3RRM5_9TELE